MEALNRYDWPGNVRELANVLERAQILAENHLITADDLPAKSQPRKLGCGCEDCSGYSRRPAY